GPEPAHGVTSARDLTASFAQPSYDTSNTQGPIRSLLARSRLAVSDNWMITGIMGPGLLPRLRGAFIRDDNEWCCPIP
ncbi:MAG: hypothetical protein CMH93_02815, partial [Oceanicaulis sp.]|nr:hypothetical protein [Oceanicaulis sp.]